MTNIGDPSYCKNNIIFPEWRGSPNLECTRLAHIAHQKMQILGSSLSEDNWGSQGVRLRVCRLNNFLLGFHCSGNTNHRVSTAAFRGEHSPAVSEDPGRTDHQEEGHGPWCRWVAALLPTLSAPLQFPPPPPRAVRSAALQGRQQEQQSSICLFPAADRAVRGAAAF